MFAFGAERRNAMYLGRGNNRRSIAKETISRTEVTREDKKAYLAMMALRQSIIAIRAPAEGRGTTKYERKELESSSKKEKVNETDTSPKRESVTLSPRRLPRTNTTLNLFGHQKVGDGGKGK